MMMNGARDLQLESRAIELGQSIRSRDEILDAIIPRALQMRLEISKCNDYSTVSTTTFSIDRNVSYFIKSII